MPDDHNDDPWAIEDDELLDDDELLEDEYLEDDELLGDEYPEEPVRPTRTIPLTAARHDDVAHEYDPVYDDEYVEEGRRRRALLVVAGALAFMLVGVALAAMLVGQGDDDLETNAASSSSSTTRRTPSSLGALPGLQPAPGVSSTAPSGSSSTSSTQATTSTTKAVTTTTEPPDGPACSPTGTSPAAQGNLPMKVAFCVDDPTPKVGQVLTLSGTAEDRDGGVTVDCVKVSWEGEEFGECYPPQADPATSFNESYTFKHTFARPGRYTVHVGAQSGKPNGSFAETTLKITVHA